MDSPTAPQDPIDPAAPTDGRTLFLASLQAAARRLSGLVRRTPVMEWRPRPSLPWVADEVRVMLKLEMLQLGGSFKLRGALNALLQAPPSALSGGVFTASGGNHGIGVALAARRLGAPSRVFLPETAPQKSEETLRGLGAQVVRRGAVWDEAWQHAERAAGEAGGLLVHPFDDEQVIAGQGTVGLELLADVPDVDLVLVAVGGGGLLGGVATATQALGREGARVVGVEPEGADAMRRSLQAGRLVRLDEVRTIAGTLAPRAVSALTLTLAQALCAGVALVGDDDMRAAQRLAWDELRLTLEPAGAATLAALLSGKVPREWLNGAKTIALLVCGANP